MSRRLATADFISKARRFTVIATTIHRLSTWAGTKKVKIICSDHGQFVQTPGSHLNGRGCPECGKLTSSHTRRKSKDKFIADAKAIHGDRCEYVLSKIATGIPWTPRLRRLITQF